MKIKCEYCGNFIEDTDETCPNCGAVNDHVMRSADGIPKTIEELKAFCQKKELPLEQMRFFIGVDYKKPKAFGIYKDDDGNFVVYKNKGDGTRAERYRGKDEAYAVNEIYQKLKSEIQIRREKNGAAAHRTGAAHKNSDNAPFWKRFLKRHLGSIVFAVIFIIVSIIIVGIASRIPNNGYYSYNGTPYYYQNSTWYGYDYANNYWYATAVDDALSDHYYDYWEGNSYSSSHDFDDFADSPYYSSTDASSDYNDDWDGGDWDWGGGDWDAGDTNWDTDW